MTTDQKRLQIIKKVCNSDSRGIDKLYGLMTNGNKPEDQRLTPKDIEKAFSRISAEMFDDDILFVPLLAILCKSVINDLFGKE